MLDFLKFFLFLFWGPTCQKAVQMPGDGVGPSAGSFFVCGLQRMNCVHLDAVIINTKCVRDVALCHVLPNTVALMREH